MKFLCHYLKIKIRETDNQFGLALTHEKVQLCVYVGRAGVDKETTVIINWFVHTTNTLEQW